jgi:hypothetical protein
MGIFAADAHFPQYAIFVKHSSEKQKRAGQFLPAVAIATGWDA